MACLSCGVECSCLFGIDTADSACRAAGVDAGGASSVPAAQSEAQSAEPRRAGRKWDFTTMPGRPETRGVRALLKPGDAAFGQEHGRDATEYAVFVASPHGREAIRAARVKLAAYIETLGEPFRTCPQAQSRAAACGWKPTCSARVGFRRVAALHQSTSWRRRKAVFTLGA